MTRHFYRHFDPLLPPAQADAVLDVCERLGAYRMYSEDVTAEHDMGDGLLQRHDAAMNFMATGGRFGRKESMETLAARTNYFRETYAYGDEYYVDGVECFRNHAGFLDAARELHGRPLVEPAIVYANILVAGQELALHTDVPEFRGANRKKFAQWLIVVMHHSGLFDRWRMPIATGVAWFSRARGGGFAFYPDGPDAPATVIPAAHNTAALLDTDSVFHGVDRVAENGAPIPEFTNTTVLRFEGGDTWRAYDRGRALAAYSWDEIRYSVSWKAYCFADEAERELWRSHADDLTLDVILGGLEADLRQRGRLDGPRPDPTTFGLLLIDEYIKFPAPTPV